jgi:magnesium chelatase subunit D
MGTRRGDPRGGARLSLIDTLRAAAPWQGVRRRRHGEPVGRSAPRVLVERDDFHVVRFKQRAETTTIFVVDASGSAALHRLAEAKGAVELLLADCYVRRDQVALIAFRGEVAEMVLPPTRSLVRAKRCLAALPGGGGTPLAAGIDAAAALSDLVQRRGGTPTVVCLTDGRANVGRHGAKGREQALADALDSATALRIAGVRSMVIDTSPRPHTSAERLAEALQGVYLPLPHADAAKLSDAVQAVGRAATADRGAG